ncbi:MAG: hypothetical protein ACYSO3_00635 [Planctomycetota bacterium]
MIEQALFYESILWNILGQDNTAACKALAGDIETALTLPIEKDIIDAAVNASTIYFAGYNDGVAEELTLKTNEITRNKSDFLEGTEKFQEVLEQGVGLKVVAIANRPTPFTTIQVPDAGPLAPYVYLSAGWNLLVEIGLALNIDLDKPERARKVGNEFIG